MLPPRFPRWQKEGDILTAAIALTAMLVLLASDFRESFLQNKIAVAESRQASKTNAAEEDSRVDAQDLIFFLEQMQGGLGEFSNVVEFGKEWYVTNETDFKTPTPTPIDGDLFYYLDDQRVYIYPSEERIAVIFAADADKGEREAFLAEYPDLAAFIDESTRSPFVRIQMSREIPWPELKAFIEMLAKDSRLLYISPVFPKSSKNDVMLTPTFIVKFEPEVTREQIEGLNTQYDVEFDPSLPVGQYRNYLLRPIGVRTAMEVLAITNVYHRNELTVWASPNFGYSNLFNEQDEDIQKGVDEIPFLTESGLKPFYYFYDTPRHLTPSDWRIAVLFNDDVDIDQKAEFLDSSQHLLNFIDDLTFSKRFLRINLTSPLSGGSLATMMKELSADSRVSFISPVFKRSEQNDSIIGDTFIVKFRTGVSETQIQAMNSLYNVEIDTSRKPGMNGWFLLRPTGVKTAMDLLRICNLYNQNDLTEYATPNFHYTNLFYTSSPSDTNYGKQWHLKNTGQAPGYGTSGEDIDAEDGWSLEAGESQIVIAIVDSGIDWDHPDLDNHIWVNDDPIDGDDNDGNGLTDDVRGWDYINNDNNPDDDDNDGGHGTCCAGLAAAETNNSLGVAGVSWESTLMAVKVLDYTGYGADSIIASGINYARQEGADVISCSWGDSEYIPALVEAIHNARTLGRDGKGCVMVFAAGNENSEILYPGFDDQVIAVGATDPDGNRWLDSPYGSDYGLALDVMAPGDTNNVVTTSIGGYTESFGGTSASCPQVSGLAALLLSQNPNLRASEVQSLIQASAEDKGRTGWDQYYGWGRINAYNALAAETPLPGFPRSIDRFEIRNGSPTPTPLAAFDQFGFLYLRGSLKGTHVPTRHGTAYYTPIPTPNPSKDEFILKDSDGTPAALVHSDNGDLFISGNVYIHQTVPTPNPNKDEFRIKDGDGTPVVLITEDGDLYLKGDYYNESNP